MMEQFLRQLESVELVRWVFCDMSGNARMKLIPGGMSAHFVAKQPRRFCTAVIPMSCNSDLPELAWVLDNGYPDCEMIPDPDSFHLVTWSQCKGGISSKTPKCVIGQVLCSTRWPSGGGPVEFDPRNVAKRQVERLAGMGLDIVGSMELQWRLCLMPTSDEVVDGGGCSHRRWPEPAEPDSSRQVHKREALLSDLCDALHSASVALESACVGSGCGQFCVSLGTRPGIRAADEAFLCREIVKQVAYNHGFLATFMPSPYPEAIDNTKIGSSSAGSLYFDHHLIERSQSTINDVQAISEESQPGKAPGPPQVLRHWLAGLVLHGPAIAALVWPTLNCYRQRDSRGQRVSWSVGNAGRADFRLLPSSVKIGQWRIESRLASSAASSHLAMAATLAAGIDGVQRQLELPAKAEEAPTLPSDMTSALAALTDDCVISEALGSQLVEFYRQIKLQFDLAKVASGSAQRGECQTDQDDEALAREAEFYLEFH